MTIVLIEYRELITFTVLIFNSDHATGVDSATVLCLGAGQSNMVMFTHTVISFGSTERECHCPIIDRLSLLLEGVEETDEQAVFPKTDAGEFPRSI